MLIMLTHMTSCMLDCTLVHIVIVQATLQKFCYDKINVLNFASKLVWVRRGANPQGPKKIWVSKTIPISFDVGVGSHKT